MSQFHVFDLNFDFWEMIIINRLKINERIGLLRSSLGLSGKEFAEVLSEKTGKKYTRSTVNNWETGGYNIKADDIIAISSSFDVPTDWLLGLSEVRTLETDIRMICQYTGLSEDAVAYLHNLESDNQKVFSSLIEHDITGVLDCINTALFANALSEDIKPNSIKSELEFDDKNRPFIKLSPSDTVLYFVDNACSIANILIRLVVAEKQIEGSKQ